jgi:hypothetical protein
MEKKEALQPLKVEVSGGSQVANTLVYGLIQTTLRGAGFDDLKLQHPYGSAESADSDDMVSLLEVLQVSNPQLFEVPVTLVQKVTDRTYDWGQPTHLVESFVYGADEYEGKDCSNAEIYRTEQAKAFLAKVHANQTPADRAAADAEELAMESKFLKHMSNPAVREVLEDLFDEKISETELAELRASVEAKQKAAKQEASTA